MRSLAAVLALIGCNEVFGIEPTQPGDAVDADGDRVIDTSDNCVDVPNPSQSDEDRDALGDECDNCPLVANFEHETGGDADGVGDSCDPNPVADGDCLIHFDSFREADAFAARWQSRAGSSPAASVEAADGVVILDAAQGTIGIEARDVEPARYDMQLRGRVTVANEGRLVVARDGADVDSGIRCGIADFQNRATQQVVTRYDDGNTIGTSTYMLTASVGDKLFVRSATSAPGKFVCIIEHGFAIGGLDLDVNTPAEPGGPGVTASRTRAEIEAIALYLYQPGTSCPPTT